MKTFLEAKYIEARKVFLAQCAWMNQKNETDAERWGGVDHLAANPESDSAKRYYGIRRRIIELTTYEDVAEEYIAELSRVIESQFETINKLNHELKVARLEGEKMEPAASIDFRSYLKLMIDVSPIPRRVGALIDLREGKRQASKTYAATTQPHLY